LSDDFSCATIVPSTAHIILDADGKNNVKWVHKQQSS
jgi:hypothetical protein